MNLPNDFLHHMSELLVGEYDDFVASYNNEAYSGLRVNTTKISVDDFVKLAPYSISPIPFVDNGFYIDNSDGWSKHPYYFAGLYYLQEPSAMLPASRLKVENGDRVLDLCAAPGGKSTELVSANPSLLIANDISYSRTIALCKNLEFAGAHNSYVTCEDPTKLSTLFTEFFDKILVDAPCSGEGMFRKHPELIKSWEQKHPKDYVEIQRSILKSAIRMLKPGGKCLYSTCTFSEFEDEENVKYILSEFPEVHLTSIDEFEGVYHCYDKYLSDSYDLSKCVHAFPHRLEGEGHFLACFEKAVNSDDTVYVDASSNRTAIDCSSAEAYIKDKKIRKNKKNVKSASKNSSLKYSELPKRIHDFMELCADSFAKPLDDMIFTIKDELVYMLPGIGAIIPDAGIRYVRTGVMIGTYNDKVGFVPSTALALYMGNNDYTNIINLSSESPYVIKYLKGETIIIDDELNDCVISKGYVLVQVDGFNLGFGKYDGNKIKNLYEKGWRYN